MERRVDSNCRSSVARGAHDSQHQVAQLPTVVSNKRSRQLNEHAAFMSNGFMLQNNRQAADIRFSISRPVTSERLKVVPSRLKLSPCGRTSTEKPSPMATSPLRPQARSLVCTLHFQGCSSKPRWANALRSVPNICLMELQLLATRLLCVV